ncbi:DnaJ family domain-containing protein [Oceanimonas marisflavi]|uniref:DnaJ family domain-containing protein n=1 Tax=Oceanimonas marisflavi TaxID=2059724 RepID=UPI000D305574|nr:DnaJ family domain-containing protein [Oceanimonas marisflavi]
MWLIDQLAEQAISQAHKEGQFENLPGAGKPQQLEDDSLVPEHLRAGYRLLKNAGYLPPELEARKEYLRLQDLLTVTDDNAERAKLERDLRRLELTLGQRFRELPESVKVRVLQK